MGFAVVDFETTGILPSYHHRVVEIGVTHVEVDGTVSGHWETVINPERDLGPQHIHGVRAAQTLKAPLFADIAPDMANLLRGRVFVAHNASFDLRFLLAEFERAGYGLASTVPHLCTMRLAAQFGLGGNAALSSACDHFGIENTLAHSAGADSLATAQLLSAYLQVTAEELAWREYWDAHLSSAQGFGYPEELSTGVVWRGREEIDAEVEVHFLERISSEAKHPRATGFEAEYLALLDRCLLDRVISVSEAEQLAATAEELGLTRAEVEALHNEYYAALLAAAWVDGVLAESEKNDLVAVAGLLRLPGANTDRPVVSQHGPAGSSPEDRANEFMLVAGDLVVLTGEMSRPRAAWAEDLLAYGLSTQGNVTKKTRLLVAADPDTLSGKGKKARDYGIPIVNEDGLARLLSHLR